MSKKKKKETVGQVRVLLISIQAKDTVKNDGKRRNGKGVGRVGEMPELSSGTKFQHCTLHSEL